MQRFARPAPRSRNRSVRAARVRATLHRLHTQGLSRSPQTVPINTEAADQTCWSAACAYAKRRGKRPYLVAGVQNQHAPSGYRPDEPAGQGACPMQPPRRLHYSMSSVACSVPRNSRTAAHIHEPKHGTRVVRRLIRFSLRARGRCAETMSYLTRSAAWVTGSARRTCSGPAPRSAHRRRRRPRGPTLGEPSVPNHSDLPRRSGRS